MSKFDLNGHRKSDKIKWIFTGVAILLIIVMLVGMCLQLFGKGKAKPSEWFNKPEPEKELVAISADGQAMYGGGNYAMPKSMAFVAPRGVGGSFNYKGSVTMTATLSNQYINGNFDWSVEYAGSPQSVTADTYVSVTPTADGAATAKVKYLKSCNYQLLVKAKLRAEGEEISDTCTVDFVKTGYMDVGIPTIDDVDFGDTVFLNGRADKSKADGTIEATSICERIYFSIDADFRDKVKSYLKFDIEITGRHDSNFNTAWLSQGAESNGIQNYQLEFDSLNITDFVVDFATYDQAYKEAIIFAWWQAYKDLSAANGGRYDNIYCNYYSNLYYGSNKLTQDNTTIFWNDEEGAGFGLSGASDGADVQPSVTLNNNVIF